VLDLPQDVVGAQARAGHVGVEEGVDRRQPSCSSSTMLTMRSLPSVRETRPGASRRCFAAGNGGTARGCPGPCRRPRGGATGSADTARNAPHCSVRSSMLHFEMRMPLPSCGAARGSPETPRPGCAPGRRRGSVAVGAVGEGAAAAEAGAHQLAVNRCRRSGGWGCDLRARHALRKIAARVGRRRVELQYRQRKLSQIRSFESQAAGPVADSLPIPRGAMKSRARDLACAEAERGATVRIWQSIRPNCQRSSWRARCASASFDASVTRANIDSPKNMRPMATPYRPPTSSSADPGFDRVRISMPVQGMVRSQH
jgi:hypothetical protein